MRSLTDQLSVYAAYHRNGTNKAIHAIFVPLITWSAMGLLSMHVADLTPDLALTPALLVSAAVLLYYLVLDFTFGVVLTVVFTVLLVTANQLFDQLGTPLAYMVFGGVFAVSWVAQILGHKVWEHRKPALADNVFQVLVAPLFVAAEIMFALGLKKELKAAIEEGMQAHLPPSAH